MKKPTVAAFFSGAGGLDLGFKNAGFEVVYANEFNKYAAQTHDANFEVKVIQEDITTLNKDSVPLVDVVIGGFPCQPFSAAGNQKGLLDPRGTLFMDLLEVVESQINRGNTPKAIVLENVANLVAMQKGKVLETILDSIKKLGYNVQYKVLNTKDFGIPQNRRRVFIVATHSQYEFPEPVELKIKAQDLLEENVPDKYYLSEKMVTYVKGGVGGFTNTTWAFDREIALTLTATMHKMHRASIDNYYTKKRGVAKLTPRECARLQGFPDNFEIPVSDTQAYIQMGNAVSVPVAQAVAEQLLKVI